MPEIKEVQPIEGERWCFNVKSRSRPTQRPWRVDLEAYSWNGACECEDFKFNREPELSRGAAAHDDHRCYHLKQARAFVMDEIFPLLAQAMGGPVMSSPGAGPSALTRAKAAAKALTEVRDLMELRQIITGLIDERRSEKNYRDPDWVAEPQQPPRKIYQLKQ